jgi:nucleotide-binding universal stress UspA family protein
MSPFSPILLASHGTPGARAAEAAALDRCAGRSGLHQLVVVPDLWKGMLGDDWLNNAVTQARFGRYVEAQLGREIVAEVARLQEAAAARGVSCSAEAMQGDPARCLVAASRKADYRLVVIGSPRPKGLEGLRSRMSLETLVRGLRVPLLVIPYPA